MPDGHPLCTSHASCGNPEPFFEICSDQTSIIPLTQNGAPQSHHSADDVGKAAALHAYQMHKQQQQERQQQDEQEGGGGGGGGAQDFIGMAMGEAANLFNAGGGQGDKMAMVQSAAMMALKIYMAQQAQSGEGGGGGGGLGGMLGSLMGGGGGPSGMMGLISKMM